MDATGDVNVEKVNLQKAKNIFKKQRRMTLQVPRRTVMPSTQHNDVDYK